METCESYFTTTKVPLTITIYKIQRGVATSHVMVLLNGMNGGLPISLLGNYHHKTKWKLFDAIKIELKKKEGPLNGGCDPVNEVKS